MSTFIINLNDTIAMSDSAVVELAKVISTCQPCVQVSKTNCNDVIIVAIICVAIVLVALFALCGFYYREKTENNKQNPNNENASNDNDKTIKYIEKLIDSLQSQTKVYGENGDFKDFKDSKSRECTMYNEALVCLIEAQQQENKAINIENLRKALKLNQ